MMKSNSIIFLLLLPFLLTKCQSPSQQINDAFRTVDKSLTNSNEVLGNSTDNIYSSINVNRQKNTMLALKADSVFNSTNIALKFMDSLKQIMQSQDTLGTDVDLAGSILISSKTGDILKEKLLAVYKYSYSSLINNSRKASLDSTLSSIAQLRVDDSWKRNYFEGTPSVAAITRLSKFQNDCRNAATISLTNIEDHLKK